MRIFLDVGSHQGQTILRVLNPVFKIDLVYGFEPSHTCCQLLNKKFDKNDRVVILNFGLWKETGDKILYNEGTQGASIFVDYKTTWNTFGNKSACSFLRASNWFEANIVDSKDEIFLKLNCEGCECDIINDLLDSNEFYKLRAVIIDYDVRKSPSKMSEERKLQKRLFKLGIKNVHRYMGRDRFEVLENVLRIKKRAEKKL